MSKSRKGKSRRKDSGTLSGVHTAGSKPSPKAIRYLAELLPDRWQKLFSVHKYGKYAGLSISCPACGERPPSELKYSARKWRWLSVHIAIKHD